MSMKMKKAALATKYNFHTRKSVTMTTNYRLLVGTTEKILRSSMKTVGISGGATVPRPLLGTLRGYRQESRDGHTKPDHTSPDASGGTDFHREIQRKPNATDRDRHGGRIH